MSLSTSVIEKSVHGSYHQGDAKFGFSAGKQCSCMSLTAICWSSVKKVNTWKENDLDFILNEGDIVYKSLNLNRTLYVDELPTQIQISDVVIGLVYPKVVDG